MLRTAPCQADRSRGDDNSDAARDRYSIDASYIGGSLLRGRADADRVDLRSYAEVTNINVVISPCKIDPGFTPQRNVQ